MVTSNSTNKNSTKRDKRPADGSNLVTMDSLRREVLPPIIIDDPSLNHSILDPLNSKLYVVEVFPLVLMLPNNTELLDSVEMGDLLQTASLSDEGGHVLFDLSSEESIGSFGCNIRVEVYEFR